jgi:LysR family transcriptional regulator, transcriptional activator of nhaA
VAEFDLVEPLTRSVALRDNALMTGLNYQHLYYFSVIAREGGLAKGAAELQLSHSTLSVQLRALEAALGEPLFERRGRALALTDFGREVQQYANEIFRLGSELLDFSAGRASTLRRLEVGVVPAVPITIASNLLIAAQRGAGAAALRVRQDRSARLLQELGAGRLHVVISDAPAAPSASSGLHAHALGSSTIALYATPELARRYRRNFPASLAGAPLLLPSAEATLRRAVERWLAARDLRVTVVAEIDDAATLRALGAMGLGLFPVRTALRGEVQDGLGARAVGPLLGLREHYVAISPERRVKHPAVAAMLEVARRYLEHDGAPPRRSASR